MQNPSLYFLFYVKEIFDGRACANLTVVVHDANMISDIVGNGVPIRVSTYLGQASRVLCIL